MKPLLLALIIALAACGKSDGGTPPPPPPPTDNGNDPPPPGPIDPAKAATVKGRVLLKLIDPAKPPKRGKIGMNGDPYCASQHDGAVLSDDVVYNASNGTLQNVFVYISGGLEGRKFTPPSTVPVLDQRGCMYVPHAIAVMAGQDMRIRSSDNVMHNVHLLPFSNREKNFGMPGPGEVSQVFNAPEIFRVKCDIHPWMNAWVGVFDHPCFAVTGATGEYEITGIPPGKYTLKAWHEKYGDIKVEVELGEKAVLTLDITLEEK